MMERITVREGGLDRWLGRTLVVNWEVLAWLAVLALAVVSRLWDLGVRAMSHDESLHTFYSWKLFDGQGYQHDPMMHGPLLYHTTALSYWLFGVSDFTARLMVVVAGVLLVASPLLLRKWLGKAGALAAGVMLLISPTVTYYTRYIRHDITVELCTVLLAIAFIRFLDDRRGRWIVLAFAAGAGAVTSAEMSYINAFVLFSFIGVLLLAERLKPRHIYMLELAFLVLGVGLLAFSTAANLGYLGETGEGAPLRVPMQLSFLFGGMLLIYALVSPLLSRVRSVPAPGAEDTPWRLGDFMPDALARRCDAGPSPSWRLPIIGTAVLVAGVVLWRLPSLVAALPGGGIGSLGLWTVAVGWFLLLYGLVPRLSARATHRANFVAMALGLVAALAWLAVWRLIPAGAFDTEHILTTIGAGDRGPAVALVASSLALVFFGLLGWLLETQAERGAAAAVAAAPVEAIAAGAIVFAIFYVLMFTTFFTNPAGINGFARSIEYWLAQHDVVRGGQPWYYYALFTPMYEFLPVFLSVVALVVYTVRRELRVGMGNDSGDPDRPAPAAWAFVPMLLLWMLGNFWIYSWAGEKMPWLIVHLVIPMTFLGGRMIGDWARLVDREKTAGRFWQVVGVTSLIVVVVGTTLVAWLMRDPVATQSQAGLARMTTWLLGVVIAAMLLWALFTLARPLARTQVLVGIGAGVAAVLLVWNTHTSLQANFVNDELATEYIVYAHGTPDDKVVYNALMDMKARLGTSEEMTLGYDNEVSWPFTWYFRDSDWKAATYLGEKPSGALQQDVVLVGSPNYGNFEPYLRDRYVSTEFRRMWWPNEGYKGLTWERVAESLTDPKLRRNWLNILLFRYYTLDPMADDPEPKSLNDWYHHADMRLYVRKDLIHKVWPLVEARPDWLQHVETGEAPSKSVEMTIETTYAEGSDGQPMVTPKDIALGPDGKLYVVDSGQFRVVVFGLEGPAEEIIGAGDLNMSQTSNQPEGPSAWGIGVGPDGAVYVADTWNHRILKYVGGVQVGKFGTYGNPSSPDVQPELLFGPRDVAFGPDGNLYVTDTGNDRIVVLDPDLKGVRAFGGSGIALGQFDEPTSLAFDPVTGELYVADLWNLRIQRFDENLTAVGEWPVTGWEGQEAAHKAYLAVGPGPRIVASDPAGQRVWIWDRDGKVLGTLDLPDDTRGLDQPIGVIVDDQGRIYVASSNSGIVTRYAALDVMQPASGADAGGADASSEVGAGESGDEGAAGEGAAGGVAGEGEAAATAGDAEGPTATGGGGGSPSASPTTTGGAATPTVGGGGAGPTGTGAGRR